MDPDSPWEQDPRSDHAPEAEWSKISSEFTNSGYREGIAAGKEASLQSGFDAGFAEIVPLGRQLGNLRGVAAALGALLNSQRLGSRDLEELRSITSALSAIQLSDIAPPNQEAEPPSVAPPQERHTMEDVAHLKQRLTLLSAKFGLISVFD